MKNIFKKLVVACFAFISLLALLTRVSFSVNAESNSDVVMHDGASVKIKDTDSTNLRFCIDISKSILDIDESNHTASLKQDCAYSEIGILILSEAQLEGLEGDLFEHLNSKSISKDEVAYVVTNDKIVYDSENDCYSFYAPLPVSNSLDYDTMYQAIAYLYDGENYTYSEFSKKRSVSMTFDLALKLTNSSKHDDTLSKAVELGSLSLTLEGNVVYDVDLSPFASDNYVIESVGYGDETYVLTNKNLIPKNLFSAGKRDITINYTNGKSLNVSLNILSVSEYVELNTIEELPQRTFDLRETINVNDFTEFETDRVFLGEKEISFRNNENESLDGILNLLSGHASNEQQNLYFFDKEKKVHVMPVTIWSLLISSYDDLKLIKETKYTNYKYSSDGNKISQIYGYYKLVNDIDITSWGASNALFNYTALEKNGKDYGFQGVFDGDNHIINGLSLSENFSSILGVIGGNAVIKNVKFTNVTFIDNIERVGVLAYYASGGKVENVFVEYTPNNKISRSNMVGVLFGWCYQISGNSALNGECSKIELKDVTLVVNRGENTNKEFAIAGRATTCDATGFDLTAPFICENVVVVDSLENGVNLFGVFNVGPSYVYSGVSYKELNEVVTAQLTPVTKAEGDSLELASLLPDSKTMSIAFNLDDWSKAESLSYSVSDRGKDYSYLIFAADGSSYIANVHVKSLKELMDETATSLEDVSVFYNDTIDLSVIASGITISKIYDKDLNEIGSIEIDISDMGNSLDFFFEDNDGEFYSITINVKTLSESLALATELSNVDIGFSNGAYTFIAPDSKTISKLYSPELVLLDSLSVTYTKFNASDKAKNYYYITEDGSFYKQPITVWSLLIDSFDDLKLMRSSTYCNQVVANNKLSYITGYYKVTADITAGDWGTDLIFCGISNAPIYDKTIGFEGTFDGGGHTIDGLHITGQGTSLFGVIGENAVIKNVNFTNVTFDDNTLYMGLIAVYAFGGTIENVRVEYDGNINSNYSGGKMIGILFGWCYYTSASTASMNGEHSQIKLKNVTIVTDRSGSLTGVNMAVCGRLETGTEVPGIDMSSPISCEKVVIVDPTSNGTPLYSKYPNDKFYDYPGVTYKTTE